MADALLHRGLAALAGPHMADTYAEPARAAMIAHGIDLRVEQAHFLAQCLEETNLLEFMAELWGPTNAQKRYEPPNAVATALGNTEPGDGERFRGRGLLQLTGRRNYQAYGDAVGIDAVTHPELLEQPEHATRSAAWYWKAHGLDAEAQKDVAGDGLTAAQAQESALVAVTKAINGGTNGLERRRAYLVALKALLLVEPLYLDQPAQLVLNGFTRAQQWRLALGILFRAGTTSAGAWFYPVQPGLVARVRASGGRVRIDVKPPTGG